MLDEMAWLLLGAVAGAILGFLLFFGLNLIWWIGQELELGLLVFGLMAFCIGGPLGAVLGAGVAALYQGQGTLAGWFLAVGGALCVLVELGWLARNIQEPDVPDFHSLREAWLSLFAPWNRGYSLYTLATTAAGVVLLRG